MKRQRQPLLPEAARERLTERLRHQLNRFAAGEDSSPEANQKLYQEIDRCFPPFEKNWWTSEPSLPAQIELWMESMRELREQRAYPYNSDEDDEDDEDGPCYSFGPYKSDEDEALGELLVAGERLEPETAAYIIRKYLTRDIYFPTLINRNREHYEFAETIRRVKLLLRQCGLKAHQADQAIADDLQITVETLRQRVQRAPKWLD